MESPAVQNARGLKRGLFTSNTLKDARGLGSSPWGFNGWRRDAGRGVGGSLKRRRRASAPEGRGYRFPGSEFGIESLGGEYGKGVVHRLVRVRLMKFVKTRTARTTV